MRSLYVITFLCLGIFSCNNKAKLPECGDPPPLNDIENYSFIIRDAAGNNMLKEGPRRLNLTGLQITQACGAGYGRADDPGNSGMMRLFLAAGPYDGKECNTAYLKWDESDTDTLTYEYTADVQKCYTRYEITSFRFNGKPANLDTTYKTPAAASHIYTLQK